MKPLHAIAAAALIASTAHAYTVNQSVFFAYFQGHGYEQPALLLLSKQRCALKAPKSWPADLHWHRAVEVAYVGSVGVPQPVEVEACWYSDPDGDAYVHYCRGDHGRLTAQCLWIGDSHFLDTRSLPTSARFN